MLTAPRFSHGVMTVTLDGEDVELAANVRASRTICRLYGGLTEVMNKANVYDFDTLVNVVNAAAGRVGKAAEATADAVFNTGIVTVAPWIVQYVQFLAAGGKVAKPETATSESGETGEEAATGEAI